MKLKSMKSKIALMMIILLIIVTVVCSFIINRVLSDIVKNRIGNEAKIILDNVVTATRTLMHHEDSEEDIYSIIKKTVSYDAIEKITFCDSEQVIVVSSNESEVGTVATNMCITSVAENHSPIASYLDVKEHIYEMAMPISEDEDLGIMYILLDSTYIENLISTSTFNVMLAIITVLVLVMLIIILFIHYLVIKPIEIIKESTEKVIRSEFDNPIKLNRNDEFNELEKAYNNMINYVKDNMSTLENDKHMAVQSSKEKMDFLARMSHEIRTPLNSIIGFSSLLLERKSNIEDKKELDIIINASNHLINVVNDILNIGRIEQDQLTLDNKSYSIKKMVAQISNMFEMQIKDKGLDFVVKVDKDVPRVLFGDSFRIKEIIINLIGNALKFTREGSISVSVTYELPFLSIAIKDTGIGISKDKQDIIFEPFEQSDDSVSRLYGGSGLGLAISKKIAELMGGDIILMSDGINGSTFTVVVKSQVPSSNEDDFSMIESWLAEDPEIESIILDFIPKLPLRVSDLKVLIEEADIGALKDALHAFKGVSSNLNLHEITICIEEFEKYILVRNTVDENYEIYLSALEKIISSIPSYYFTSDTNSNITSKRSHRLKVLLAEDVIENRYLIKMLLKNNQVDIDEASNGEEAINKLGTTIYDVLLLDIQMPIKSGIDVLHWLKDNGNHKPEHVIALSANARREDMESYISLGCTDYLSKPVDKQLLRDKIDRI